MGVVESSSTQRVGYVNTFGRETVIDSALTSTLQAPVKVSLVRPAGSSKKVLGLLGASCMVVHPFIAASCLKGVNLSSMGSLSLSLSLSLLA